MALVEHSIASPLLAVVPAAGMGSRMGLPLNKIFLPLPAHPVVESPVLSDLSSDSEASPSEIKGSIRGSEDTILARTLRTLLSSTCCQGIVVVSREAELGLVQGLLESLAPEFPKKLLLSTRGGESRQESVYRGLLAISGHEPQWVLIHDAARPFLSLQHLESVIIAAQEKGAAILATPARQTLKRSLDGDTIIQTIPRDEMWEAQTPQVFRFQEILRAHRQAVEENYLGTDDSELYERIGGIVHLVRGDETNLKITTPFDLEVAKVLQSEAES